MIVVLFWLEIWFVLYLKFVEFEGKKVIVIGGVMGIGCVIVLVLVVEGVKIIICDINLEVVNIVV